MDYNHKDFMIADVQTEETEYRTRMIKKNIKDAITIGLLMFSFYFIVVVLAASKLLS